MRWFKQPIVLFVLMVGLAASVPLQAGPIVWQLVGVTFSDGASASGSFTYDAATDVYSAWNISVAAGILTAYTYQPSVDGGFVGIHPTGQVDFVAFPPATSGRYVRLAFASPLTNGGGIDRLRADNSGYECNNCSTFRYIRGGQVASVPEPSNLTLLFAAFALAVVFRRARTRLTYGGPGTHKLS
jgi:hypothetical protein